MEETIDFCFKLTIVKGLLFGQTTIPFVNRRKSPADVVA